jgi:serine phosphatase RsbU (regulator of sigma subunit)
MSGGNQAGHTVLATHATIAEAFALRDELRSYLVVLDGEDVVARYPVSPEPLTIGRDESRDIVIADSRVSRLHMQVFLADGNVVAEDLGSSNGTFLDGQRLQGPVVLPEGRWLQVGSRFLKHERRSRKEVERDQELQRELDKARNYVTSLLPAPIVSGPIRTDWCFQPSTQLGGDAFSYGRLDDTHVLAYLIDVSGHGVGAAMHSVTVLNVLRQRALPNTDFHDPAQVLSSLNAMFQMDDHDGMYFTAWYGVYSLANRTLAYATAGHHPGYLYAPYVPRADLKTPGLMIGATPSAKFVSHTVDVPRGAALYLFSDGVFEVTSAEGRQCGLADLMPLLAGTEAAVPGETARVLGAVKRMAKPGPLDDDFSLLLIRFD